MGFRVQGSGFRFRVQGLGFRFQGLGLMVRGSGLGFGYSGLKREVGLRRWVLGLEDSQQWGPFGPYVGIG